MGLISTGCPRATSLSSEELRFLTARGAKPTQTVGAAAGHVTRPHSLVACMHAGDVLLHTVTDAILGALSLPDIGTGLRASSNGENLGLDWIKKQNTDRLRPNNDRADN